MIVLLRRSQTVPPVILRRSQTDVRIYFLRINRTPPTASSVCARR